MITTEQLNEIQTQFGPLSDDSKESKQVKDMTKTQKTDVSATSCPSKPTAQAANEQRRQTVSEPQMQYRKYRDLTTAEMIGGTERQKEKLFNQLVLKKLKEMKVDLLEALHPSSGKIVDAAKAVYNEEVARPLGGTLVLKENM